MKRKFKACLIGLFVSLGPFSFLNAQIKVNSYEMPSQSFLAEKAKKLRVYYANAFKGKEAEKYQELFFLEFPSTFSELNALYGHSVNDSGTLVYSGILSDVNKEHITDLFNHITYVNEKQYYTKIIAIAIGGEWDADGINEFQRCLKEHCLKNPLLLFNLLESRNENEIKSFWCFFFDGYYPNQTTPVEFDGMDQRYASVFLLMKKAHEDVLRNRK